MNMNGQKDRHMVECNADLQPTTNNNASTNDNDNVTASYYLNEEERKRERVSSGSASAPAAKHRRSSTDSGDDGRGETKASLDNVAMTLKEAARLAARPPGNEDVVSIFSDAAVAASSAGGNQPSKVSDENKTVEVAASAKAKPKEKIRNRSALRPRKRHLHNVGYTGTKKTSDERRIYREKYHRQRTKRRRTRHLASPPSVVSADSPRESEQKRKSATG